MATSHWRLEKFLVLPWQLAASLASTSGCLGVAPKKKGQGKGDQGLIIHKLISASIVYRFAQVNDHSN